jgi:hypothetical protein
MTATVSVPLPTITNAPRIVHHDPDLLAIKRAKDEAAGQCVCWGVAVFKAGGRLAIDPAAPAGQGGLLGLGRPPCTRQTCSLFCRACQIAGRPFFSDADLRFLDGGPPPPDALGIERLWQRHNGRGLPADEDPYPKGDAAHNAKAWCGVCGADRKPGTICKPCAARRRRETRASKREAARVS